MLAKAQVWRGICARGNISSGTEEVEVGLLEGSFKSFLGEKSNTAHFQVIHSSSSILRAVLPPSPGQHSLEECRRDLEVVDILCCPNDFGSLRCELSSRSSRLVHVLATACASVT